MIAVAMPAQAMRRASRVSGEQKRSIVRQQVMESGIEALLDAHDALIRACVESRLAFGEFVAACGEFPMELDGEGESFGSEVGRFMPMVGLMRLRELVERYPNLRCGVADQIESSEK